MSKPSGTRSARFLAVLPAAGSGTRLPDRACSKEILEVPVTPELRARDEQVQPVIGHLLRALKIAGVGETRVVLRNGKWDIPERLDNGDWNDLGIMYIVTRGTSGVPETVALGLRDNPDAVVAFGFPDILFEPVNAFERLRAHLDGSRADVVVGAFPTENPAKMDMLRIDPGNRVVAIDIKPEKTSLEYAWILAVWRPSFTRWLIDLYRNAPERLDKFATDDGDRHLGHAFKLSIEDGLLIEAAIFANGRSLDIGTPEDLEKARRWCDGVPGT